MSRLRSDFFHRYASGAVVMAVLMGVLLGGCASTGPGAAAPDRAARSDRAVQPDAGDSAGDREQPARPALVEVEADVGFTVTEVVPLPSDVRADYRRALSLLAQDDVKAGIALLVEVTEKVPQATAPLVDLGIAYSHAGSLDKAEAALKRALAATPDHPVAHNELGIVYRKQGKFAEARASYERALAIYPGFHYARRNLAVLCDLFLTDLPCALEQYELYRGTVSGDREVDIWISDIRNRLAANDPETANGQ